MTESIEIRPIHLGEMDLVRNLFREYANWLQVDLCFQDFETELATLPGAYARPSGGLWLAELQNEPAGIIGFRPVSDGRCEMKRLWVRPSFRGRGLGRRLTESLLLGARKVGYETICLDTLGFMDVARRLYTDLGFREIPDYYEISEEDLRYMELDLTKLIFDKGDGLNRP